MRGKKRPKPVKKTTADMLYRETAVCEHFQQLFVGYIKHRNRSQVQINYRLRRFVESAGVVMFLLDIVLLLLTFVLTPDRVEVP